MEELAAFSAGGAVEPAGGSVVAMVTVPTRLVRGVDWLCLCVMSA